MDDKKYIQSVVSSSRPKKYPQNKILLDKKNLEKALQLKGLKIQLKESLKGGFISQVYSANLDGKDVVVKHTSGSIPSDPTEMYLDKKSHNVDCQVLKNLQSNHKIKVPKLLYDFPNITTSVMENLYSQGFKLMQNKIFDKNLPINAAERVGRMIGNLIIESRTWKKFSVVQTAIMSIYERGLELRQSYPNSQKEYLELEKKYVENNKFWSWPDCHPKNIFVNKKGEVAFIDFGYSQWGDQRFVLPSHLAHIVIYCLAGYIGSDLAKEYIEKCVSAYREIEPIDELLFCQYLAMEVFHRANGKWITGIDTKKQKLALLKFGYTVFDEKIYIINKLLNLL
ncbi:MAG: hypothetical protein UR89_C0003G0007 [Candidatus Roizmanbacteria bacterium GW2011_GWA2_35_8]|uniref:Aminoglycoside phosphotransferase domain-containing protein n=1 Tax=Candidatus Roizmanbacteria bacterium GW2011_GWA2_35_8 TaxID=1618479 RepID=A0A0G0G6B6_9BACT|nr:MAG: hypothetical protein UR89_C0003G0007 [Candidatus Roizmanbacteria bacterium GW2011_GWA2_35_8]